MLLSWYTESHVEGQQESSIIIFPLGPHNKLIRPYLKILPAEVSFSKMNSFHVAVPT